MGNISKRIVKEWEKLQKEPIPNVTISPINNDMRYLKVIIVGAKDTPYEDGNFELEMYLPPDYPIEVPKCRYVTNIYHPNINQLGQICLDILKDKWSPALQIRTLILSIMALMSTPNEDDP